MLEIIDVDEIVNPLGCSEKTNDLSLDESLFIDSGLLLDDNIEFAAATTAQKTLQPKQIVDVNIESNKNSFVSNPVSNDTALQQEEFCTENIEKISSTFNAASIYKPTLKTFEGNILFL